MPAKSAGMALVNLGDWIRRQWLHSWAVAQGRDARWKHPHGMEEKMLHVFERPDLLLATRECWKREKKQEWYEGGRLFLRYCCPYREAEFIELLDANPKLANAFFFHLFGCRDDVQTKLIHFPLWNIRALLPNFSFRACSALLPNHADAEHSMAWRILQYTCAFYGVWLGLVIAPLVAYFLWRKDASRAMLVHCLLSKGPDRVRCTVLFLLVASKTSSIFR